MADDHLEGGDENCMRENAHEGSSGAVMEMDADVRGPASANLVNLVGTN